MLVCIHGGVPFGRLRNGIAVLKVDVCVILSDITKFPSQGLYYFSHPSAMFENACFPGGCILRTAYEAFHKDV